MAERPDDYRGDVSFPPMEPKEPDLSQGSASGDSVYDLAESSGFYEVVHGPDGVQKAKPHHRPRQRPKHQPPPKPAPVAPEPPAADDDPWTRTIEPEEPEGMWCPSCGHDLAADAAAGATACSYCERAFDPHDPTTYRTHRISEPSRWSLTSTGAGVVLAALFLIGAITIWSLGSDYFTIPERGTGIGGTASTFRLAIWGLISLGWMGVCCYALLLVLDNKLGDGLPLIFAAGVGGGLLLGLIAGLPIGLYFLMAIGGIMGLVAALIRRATL